ncbi:hypothetical protein ACA910_018133 [Epithemia clementina (nom. ined.)]
MDYYQEKGGDPVIPSLRMDPQVFKSLVFTSTILGLKLLFSVCATTISEQYPWMLEKLFQKKVGDFSIMEATRRLRRGLDDDLENIPAGLGLLWLAGLTTLPQNTLTPPTTSISTAVIALAQAFAVLRLAHSAFAYAGSAVWYRSIVYLGGVVSSCGAGLFALKGIFNWESEKDQ